MQHPLKRKVKLDQDPQVAALQQELAVTRGKLAMAQSKAGITPEIVEEIEEPWDWKTPLFWMLTGITIGWLVF